MGNGYDATLKFDSKHGKANVVLECDLGRPFPPPTVHKYYPVHRNKSYFHRQERRHVANCSVSTQAEEAYFNETMSSSDVNVNDFKENEAEEASLSVNMTESSSIIDEAETAVNNSDKNVIENGFCCSKCDFVSTWKNGLRIHLERVHENENVTNDENEESDEETGNWDKYDSTEHYWRRGRLGQSYQCYLDALSVIDECRMSEKEKDIEKENILEARKRAFGDNHVHFPPWKKCR